MLLDVIRSGFDISTIIICLLSSFVVIFLTMPIHEWAHGFVSSRLGDPTPRYQGRLTLNPMAHIDVMGAIGILLFGIGWAKPVQVNPRYYKNSKWGMALVAAAGPLSNIIVAFIALLLLNVAALFATALFVESGVIYTYVGVDYGIADMIMLFLYYIAIINISLAVFNLIPVPPFDGSRILFTFLPQKYYFMIMRYEQYIFIGLLLVLYAGVLDGPLAFARENVMTALNYLAALPFKLFIG